MATNEIIRYHSANRLRVLFTTDHTAGDLVHIKGFYGWVQDDVDVSVTGWGTLHMAGVYELTRAPASSNMGTKLYAPATEIATSLPLISGATTGWNPVGRTTATQAASGIARVRLFAENNY